MAHTAPRQPRSSLRGRLQRSFGGPAADRGFVVSTRSRGGGGRGSRRALQMQREQFATFNKQIMDVMRKQRKQQAHFMKQARGAIKKSGKADIRRLREGGVRQQAAGTQMLTSRGLGNTTIQGSLARGIESDVQRNIGEVKSRQAGQLAGLFSREAGMSLPQGQLGLQGIGMQGGGLQDYIRLMMMAQGGLS